MKALNLTPGFRPFPRLPEVAFERIDFPSGFEPHIRITDPKSVREPVIVTCRFESAADLMLIGVAVDAAWRLNDCEYMVHLFVPFLPHARQDRVVVDGDACSKIAVLNMLSKSGPAGAIVHVFDVHSDKDRWPHRNNLPYAFWMDVMTSERPISQMARDIPGGILMKDFMAKGAVIAIPDKGAKERILPWFSDRFVPTVFFDKVRNKGTGRIENISMSVPSQAADIKGKTCFILDDICDGGGTFIPIAQQLKAAGASRVVLVVSHGIFSKGMLPLMEGGIDHIYTTDSVKSRYTKSGYGWKMNVLNVGNYIKL